MSKPSYSFIAVIFSIVLIAYAGTIHFHRWGSPRGESTFGWDCGSYYQYLPSLFIYDDIKTQHLTDSVKDIYDFKPGTTPISRADTINVIVYSSGMALVYAPAFAVAHTLAEPLGYPPDGFSMPYQFCVSIFCLLIVIIGVWYFRKLLLCFFDDKVVAITVVLLTIGTNYFNYASADANAPHCVLFTIYVFLLLSTRKFYLSPNVRSAMAIGVLYGLLVLIRPSEMVAALIPILWGLNSLKIDSIKKHFNFLLSNIKYLLITSVCAIAVGSIQILYWYYVTGKPIHYSYQYSFFWDGRFIYDFLLCWGHGWLMYSPMIWFAIIGLIIYFFKGKHKVAIILFILLNFYIVSAWEIWWYSGIPGRAMIQSYAVLAFPFAVFVDSILKKRLLKWIFGSLALLFIYFNMWLFHNAHLQPALFDPDGMTGAYYRAVVGRWNVTKAVVEKLKDTDELFTGTPKNIQTIYFNDFEPSDTILTGAPVVKQSPVGGIDSKNGIYFDEHISHSTFYKFKHNNTENADWVRASVDVSSIAAEWENWRMIQFIVTFLGEEGNIVKTKMIRLSRFARTIEPHHVFFDTEIPEEPYKYIQVHFWNVSSDGIMLIDNLKVESFQE